ERRRRRHARHEQRERVDGQIELLEDGELVAEAQVEVAIEDARQDLRREQQVRGRRAVAATKDRATYLLDALAIGGRFGDLVLGEIERPGGELVERGECGAVVDAVLDPGYVCGGRGPIGLLLGDTAA